jgi:HAD superfamily hydrolase (TIGR01509 family)
MLQGIIFDFNGVLLWDSHLHEMAWNECARNIRGREFSEEEIDHQMHGRTNGDIIQYLSGQRLEPDRLQQFIDRKEDIYHKLCLKYKDEFKLAPYATEFLDYLKGAKIPMTIATSSGTRNLKFYYEHLSLATWFDYDVVAHDDGTMKGKPEPDLYLHAAKNLGLKPSQCIVFEDARSGITAAHRAGIGKIIAIGPKQKHKALAALQGVNQTIAGFDELLHHPDSLWLKS